MIGSVRYLYSQAKRLVRGYILGDEMQLAAAHWFRDRGDERLRLDYPLDPRSVVIDCGGYEGDWAKAIADLYGARVHVFEPVPAFAANIASRLASYERVHVHAFGLQGGDSNAELHLDDNASSVFGSTRSVIVVQLRDVSKVLSELDLEQVDLIKINIEGGEYDLLERLISTGDIGRFGYIQVQFHDFVPEARSRRDAIRKELRRSHLIQWEYPFVWESWQRKP